MDISLFLAQAFGIYFVVMGLLLFRNHTLGSVVSSLSQNKSLKFFIGVFILILGIILVLVHNIWEGPMWQVLITIFAWLTFIKGLMYLFVPQDVFDSILRALNKKGVFIGAGIITFVIGAWLASIGFGL